MKKVMMLLLCLSLVLAGCGKKTPESTTEVTGVPETVPATTQKPTEEPTTVPTETEPPVPETVSATALADRTYVVSKMLDRDEPVEVVGEFDEIFYIVKTEEGYGLIEKCLVRMDGAESYKSWTGYAVYNAKLYNNYHLLPGEEQKLSTNTQVQVLEDLGTCLVVQHEENIFYMRPAEVSKHYIQPSTGGSGNTGGADGGDIILGNWSGVMRLSSFIPQEGEVTGNGIVLVNLAEIYLGWFDRNDTVAIITEEGFMEEKEGWCAVYHEGLYGYVRQNLIQEAGAEDYAEWDGFAQYLAPVYANYYLNGEPETKLSTNTKVHILEDLGNCYLVISGDISGYMAKETVSQSFINYGGGGGGGDTGGDWTPPAM